MKFAICPVLGTLDRHRVFETAFIAGISLAPIPENLIETFSRTRARTEAVDEAEAVARLAALVDLGAAQLVTFRDRLTDEAGALTALVKDAKALADMPADIAGDAQIIEGYIAKAETAANAVPDQTEELKVAQQISRWFGRIEASDKTPIVKALDRFERAEKSINGVQARAVKAAADLREHLAAIRSDATAKRIASVKLNRDLLRRAPELTAMFERAQARAAEAIAEMAAVAGELKALTEAEHAMG